MSLPIQPELHSSFIATDDDDDGVTLTPFLSFFVAVITLGLVWGLKLSEKENSCHGG